MICSNNDPLVSVIIPAYNSEDTLNDCIQSVVCQSYENLEIIVVNDGSRDNTKAIIEKFSSADPRVILVNKKENEGRVLTRDSGIKNAHGKYIQYLDSDDTLRERAIEYLLAKAEITGADMVVAPFLFHLEDGKVERSLNFDFKELSGIDYLKAMMTGKAYWCVWAKFHLRSLYEHSIVCPNISLGEDIILSTQLCFFTKKVATIHYEIINYNFSSSSTSHLDNFDDAKYEDFRVYTKWFNDYIEQSGLSEELRKEKAYFHVRTVQRCFLGKQLVEMDREIKSLVSEIKEFPCLLKVLSKRERKIVTVYQFSYWLGYLNLKRYRWQGKL